MQVVTLNSSTVGIIEVAAKEIIEYWVIFTVFKDGQIVTLLLRQSKNPLPYPMR